MTDHTIPADKVRELIDDLREEAAELENEEWGSMIMAERAAELRGTADRIESLLPAPPIDPATCAPDRLYRVEHHNGQEHLGWRLAPDDSEYPWMISGGWWCRDHHLTVLGEAAMLDPSDAQDLADLADDEPELDKPQRFGELKSQPVFHATEREDGTLAVDIPTPDHIPAGEAWVVEISGEEYHALPDRTGTWHYIDDEGDHAEDWRAVPLHRLVERFAQEPEETVSSGENVAADQAYPDPDGEELGDTWRAVWESMPGTAICAGDEPGRDTMWIFMSDSGVYGWVETEKLIFVRQIWPIPQQQARTVTTESEYAALPIGTLVSPEAGAWVYVKMRDKKWEPSGSEGAFSDIFMSGVPRRVLRHGWGDEEEA